MATTREIKIPGPEHPMSIEPITRPVSVTVEGIRIAESTNALVRPPFSWSIRCVVVA
jgi:hypothetical protein